MTNSDNKENLVKILKPAIPYVGITELHLYSPATKIYNWLRNEKEYNRLNSLRHLGTLSVTFQGARHYRWDYTNVMLYYCNQLDSLPKMKAEFNIEGIQFTSVISALQSIALLWNIGHLPGTFSIEKGVYRYLFEVNSKYPISGLTWPEIDGEYKDRIINSSNEILLHDDYLSLSRVLAILKMLTMRPGKDGYFRNFAYKFAIPFILEPEAIESEQINKIIEAFNIIRHLAYLTIDSIFTGITWSPNVPAVVKQLLGEKNIDLPIFASTVSEILSPLERVTFEKLYHNNDARIGVAIAAERAYQHLRNCDNPSDEILRWLKLGLFRELNLNEDYPKFHEINLCGEIRVRSHFATTSKTTVVIDSELRKMGAEYPATFLYKPWNSDLLLEPGELIIDWFSTTKYSSINSGKLILWIISNLDSMDDDTISIFVKNDLEKNYVSLISKAIESRFEIKDFSMQISPWPLEKFGIFGAGELRNTKGSIWATDSRMNDLVSKKIFSPRHKEVPNQLKTKYAELLGLRKLRQKVSKNWLGRIILKQRFLIITGSILFLSGSTIIKEFDGAIIKISTSSGQMVFYGLETKTNKENALVALQKSTSEIGINGKIYLLNNFTHNAVFETIL